MNAFVTYIGQEEEAKSNIISALATLDIEVKGEDASLDELLKIYNKATKRKAGR